MTIQHNYTDTVFTEDHLVRFENSAHVFPGTLMKHSKGLETVFTREQFSQHHNGFTMAECFSVTSEFDGMTMGVVTNISTITYEELLSMYAEIPNVFLVGAAPQAVARVETVFMEEEITAHSEFTSALCFGDQ